MAVSNVASDFGQQKVEPVTIISGVIALASMISNIVMTRQQNRENRELAEYQNRMNIEQWYRENAYNTPQAQMQRLMSAGLNPSLMYAGGNFTNQAASSPELSSSLAPAQRFEIDPSQFNQAMLMDAQKQALQAQARDLNADAELKGTQENQISTLLPVLLKQYQAQVDLLNQKVKVEKALATKLDFEAIKASWETHWMNRLKPVEVKSFEKKYDITCQEFEYNVQHIQLAIAQEKANIEYTKSATASNFQGVRESEQNIAESKDRQVLLHHQGNILMWDNMTKEFEYGLLVGDYGRKKRALELFAAHSQAAILVNDVMASGYNSKMAKARCGLIKSFIVKNYTDIGFKALDEGFKLFGSSPTTVKGFGR